MKRYYVYLTINILDDSLNQMDELDYVELGCFDDKESAEKFYINQQQRSMA